MKKISILILLFINLVSYSQNKNVTDKYSLQITIAKGDLNKDNIEDKVVVRQDTINENAPYRIQVFLSQPDGKYKLVASSTKLIENQYPGGRDGYRTGTSLSDVTIKKGILIVHMDLLRGNYQHKFRFQNGNMELIGFSSIYADGHSTITTIDFNLSTGIKYEQTEEMSGEKPNTKTKKKLIIRPLPKLQDVVPFENEFY